MWNFHEDLVVSVGVIGMVIGKTYLHVKANIHCDICYFDIVAWISEVAVIKFDFWRDGLEDVSEGVPDPNFELAVASLLDSNFIG